ncbi:hypothetical protein AAG570_005674 [Ranatra chinensis]|uniref:EF-hand domain-containing protein n=1 Tax=Ranatra chinensis TaxID=642074 RepID=A0ABD0YGH5_9HEMI
MASKRRNMFYESKKQETTEIEQGSDFRVAFNTLDVEGKGRVTRGDVARVLATAFGDRFSGEQLETAFRAMGAHPETGVITFEGFVTALVRAQRRRIATTEDNTKKVDGDETVDVSCLKKALEQVGFDLTDQEVERVVNDARERPDVSPGVGTQEEADKQEKRGPTDWGWPSSSSQRSSSVGSLAGDPLHREDWLYLGEGSSGSDHSLATRSYTSLFPTENHRPSVVEPNNALSNDRDDDSCDNYTPISVVSRLVSIPNMFRRLDATLSGRIAVQLSWWVSFDMETEQEMTEIGDSTTAIYGEAHEPSTRYDGMPPSDD